MSLGNKTDQTWSRCYCSARKIHFHQIDKDLSAFIKTSNCQSASQVEQSTLFSFPGLRKMKIFFSIKNCYTLNSIRGQAGKYELISHIGIFGLTCCEAQERSLAALSGHSNLSLRVNCDQLCLSGSQTLLITLMFNINLNFT